MSGPSGTEVTSLLSDADVTERLLLEFEATLGLSVVSTVIRGCRAELRNAAPAYPAESLEALVRFRLAALHPPSLHSPSLRSSSPYPSGLTSGAGAA